MTITDVVGRMQQIQLTLSQLSGVQGTGAVSASGTSASSAGAFANALTAVGGTSVGGLSGGGTSVTGADIVNAASKYIGVPYVFGGESTSGMDCSGLVQQTFKDLGVRVPRLVSGQATLGTAVPSLAQAQPGDLIVLKGDTHIAIYLGNGKILHAPRPGKSVTVADAYMSDAQIETIRRVAPSGPATTSIGLSGSSGASGVSASAVSALSALMSSGLLMSSGQLSSSGLLSSGQLSSTELLASAQAAIATGGSL
jgi:hypothetical protein